jgi:hypothetical protein
MLRLKASFFSACLLGYQLRAVIEKYKIPATAQECSFQIALLNQTGLENRSGTQQLGVSRLPRVRHDALICAMRR